MKKVIYPGTFDPLTYGHVDIVERAVELFDEVIVTVARNPSKTCLFSVDERMEMLKETFKNSKKVTVSSFDGLMVDFAKQVGAVGMIRGLRAVSDFEYELQMALMNRKLEEKIKIIFLMPHEKYTYLNSTIIRNLAQFKSDVSQFVPDFVAKKIKEKYETMPENNSCE